MIKNRKNYLWLLLPVFLFSACQKPTNKVDIVVTNQTSMKLTSTAFANEQPIPAAYTCDGKDTNPPLQIGETPDGAKSLVLIVDDPDAPAGDFVHWLLWNIGSDTKEIRENSIPAGAVEGTTDFGKTGWGGPCPPGGTHRYYFKLYALDITLNLPPVTKKAGLESAMTGHVLGQASLMGKYRRGN